MANKTYINSVTVQGFIGADAHPKELDGGKIVLNFSVATSRFRGEGEAREQFTEWHRITVWDKLAGSTGHLAKGAHVNVIGELRPADTASPAISTRPCLRPRLSRRPGRRRLLPCRRCLPATSPSVASTGRARSMPQPSACGRSCYARCRGRK